MLLIGVLDEYGLLLGEVFPALDDDVAVVRVELHHAASPLQLLACHEGGATSAEGVEDELSWQAAVDDELRKEADGLHGRMKGGALWFVFANDRGGDVAFIDGLEQVVHLLFSHLVNVELCSVLDDGSLVADWDEIMLSVFPTIQAWLMDILIIIMSYDKSILLPN